MSQRESGSQASDGVLAVMIVPLSAPFAGRGGLGILGAFREGETAVRAQGVAVGLCISGVWPLERQTLDGVAVDANISVCRK